MIILPEIVWANLLEEFAATPGAVERVAYLDGVEIDEVGIVTTLTVPDAELHPTYFRVSSASMSEAGAHFREYGLLRLAQVHTHPGYWVDHSGEDDRRAYSQIVGAISIVLPDHARNRPSPYQGGVHVRGDRGWRRLPDCEARALIKTVPSVLNYRRGRGHR